MMFKKFFGKTVEAAKNSARQMYGDDFTIFDTHANGITVAVDKKAETTSPAANFKPQIPPRPQAAAEGVLFEKSGHLKMAEKNGTRSTLDSLRQKAKQNQKGAAEDDSAAGLKGPSQGKTGSKPGKNFTPGEKKSTASSNGTNQNGFYSRRDLLRSSFQNRDQQNPEPNKESIKPESRAGNRNKANSGNSVLALFDQSKPKIKQSEPVKQEKNPLNRHEAREIKALHKRLDKLEALLDSNLMTSNIGYISHPAFQQLMKAGIHPGTITRWFGSIMKEGTDPYLHTQQFMTHLSKILKDVLSADSPEEPKKFQLFTGPAGSGKTELIMKLALHPGYMHNKNIAVVSLVPSSSAGKTYYYTTLKPFCEDSNIPYHELTLEAKPEEIADELTDKDYVLIDTPSLETEKENSFRQYWEIRQFFSSFSPLEVHYVVNISMHHHYFRDRAAMYHPMQPDYIALTHLDAVSQWGGIIPLFEDMGANARYISKGQTVPGSVDTFTPVWFAKQLLQDT